MAQNVLKYFPNSKIMALNHSEVPVQNLKISIFLQYFNNILSIYIFAFHSASDCYLMSD